jgi:phosphoribosyl-AMP cyclohydrolase
VATSAKTGEVLMLAYMNAEALARTIETGEAHYWSRSRGRLWRKGEESGNAQRVVEMRTDCDQDAIWLKVEGAGAEAACHTGRRSCFYRAVPLGAAGAALIFVDAERQFDPESVYRHAGAAKGTLKSSQ